MNKNRLFLDTVFIQAILNKNDRQKVVNFVRQCYQTDNMRVVNITTELFEQGLSLYESRLDKSWGLVDCLSFVTVDKQGSLSLDRPFSIIQNSRVEVIVLIPETVDIDEDDEPIETREEILEDFRQAWHEAMIDY